MELKVAFVIVCLCALAITPSEAGIPKCCITTRTVPQYILRKVQFWYQQSDTGPCDISALILHVRGQKKIVCGDLSLKKYLPKIKQCKYKKTC